MSAEQFKEMDNEKLKEFIANNDHNEEIYERDDGETESIHIDWDCEKCEAEKEQEQRYNVLISKKPGNIPYMGNSISKSVFANDIKAGDCASYLSRPGTSSYPHEYAECISVWYNPDWNEMHIEWRKTNTNKKSFYAIYDPIEYVNIIRAF